MAVGTPHRRTVLSGVVAVSTGAIAGCSGLLGGGDSPCDVVQDSLSVMAEGNIETYVEQYYATQYDTAAESARGLAEATAMTWGFPDADLENVECVCTEELSGEELLSRIEGGTVDWHYTQDPDRARVIRYEIRTSQGAAEGITLLFEIDGEGWFIEPLGALAKDANEECV
jgi:hypothetical protein